jgi:RecB family exonuclease
MSHSFGTTDYRGDPIAILRYPKQKAWSFSTVKQHDQCPAVIRFRKIDRLPEPKSVHLQRGIDVHAEVADIIAGGGRKGLDAAWLPILRGLHNLGARTEVQQAFTDAWTPTEWFADDAWLRVVLDAIVDTAEGIDVWEWKTGKAYPDHEQQGRLYALAALLLYPAAPRVDVHLRYLDRFGEGMDLIGFTHSHIPALKEEFNAMPQEFLNDEIYPARPNRYCRHCHFRKTNGGPCAFG